MIHIKDLGLQPYSSVLEQMKCFTSARQDNTPDELWLLEHPKVYTQGQAGKTEHLVNPGFIPVIQSDRGGQVTYHGPGQLVAYVLMDIGRRNIGTRTLVNKLEHIVIDLLNQYHIQADTLCGAPGVYVQHEKIASIGLRVKKGCTYHGIALNVSMDLNPFKGINPCGYAGLNMTQMSTFCQDIVFEDVKKQFVRHFLTTFEC